MGIHQALWTAAGAPAPAPGPTATSFDYEYTPSNNATILGYYNGGADGAGNIGPALGVTHQSTLSRSQGYLGAGAGPVSPVGNSTSSQHHILMTGTSAWVTMSAGFTGQFSCAYASLSTVTLTIYDNVDATGAALASTVFPAVPTASYDDLSMPWWNFMQLSFAGTAKSVKFQAGAFLLALDDLVFGSTNYVYPRIPCTTLDGVGAGGPDSMTFRRDGRVALSGSLSIGELFSAWCSNPQATVGDGYWIRATVLNGTFTGDATGSWLQLSADRSWTCSTAAGTLQVQISSDASGTPLLASTDAAYALGNPGLSHLQWL